MHACVHLRSTTSHHCLSHTHPLTLLTLLTLTSRLHSLTHPDRPPGYQPEAGRGSLYPNEVASDFAFIPFGGGARKCVGDQFALFEATVAFAMLLRRFTFRLAGPAEAVGMATGATIHTANGMMMRVTPRACARGAGASRQAREEGQPAAAAV